MPAFSYSTARAARSAASSICARVFVVERRRGRLLDQLLVSALDRALALAEREHAALAVRQHLDLDVPGRDDRLFEIEPRLAERSLRFGGRRLERAFELVRLANRSHALAAPARDGLEQHRIARFVSG